MDRAFTPLARIEIDEASPSHQGFTLAGRGSDHGEYRVDVRFDMPLDQRTRAVLGELLTHSDMTISRRTQGPLAAPVRARHDRAPRR